MRFARWLPLTWPLLACAHAHGAPPAPDPVFVAMEAELGRAARAPGLALPGYDAPYFVALVVRETQRAELTAKEGALYGDTAQRHRVATADVRVGSYAADSSDDPNWEWLDEGVVEPSNVVALDDRADALRHTLWLVTDFRYKQALTSWLRLKGQGVHAFEDPEHGPSFTPAKPVQHLDPLARLTFDALRWRETLRALSARLAKSPILYDSEVRLEATTETRWYLSSEGTRLRTVQTLFALQATGWTRAPDGMQLDHQIALYAPSEGALPSSAQLEREIDGLVATLAALRDAPLLEPYTGPAILAPTASAVLFHEVLGHRLEGSRQDDDDGQTFARHLGQPVMPPFLSLVDDPTLTTLAGAALNGFYRFDDEGVPAERVTLVDHGVLTTFLNARRPGPGAERSNGHGRAQGTQRPVARQANLVLVAHEPQSEAALRERLLAEVRRLGKPFGLIVRDLAGGQTNTSSSGYQAFKGEARTVYKVDAASGLETLVRGVDLVGTPLTTLGKILAAGDRLGVFNGYCGAESGMVPVSAVAPAILLAEVELQRSARPRTRAPILPSPTATTSPARTPAPPESHP